MSLKDNIQKDLLAALKEKRSLEASALRMLSAAIVNKEKEKMAELTEEDLMSVVSSEVKKRRDSADAYRKGDREESAQKEEAEIEVFKRYLPEQISEDELKKMVQESIEKVSAQDMKDMGKIMADLMPKVKGRAEGSLISKIVKELLIN